MPEAENMKPLIIPVFITGKGCPHRCVFCCGRITAGPPEEISRDFLRDRVLQFRGRPGRPAQLAFYGGNFTGLPLAEQQRILLAAGEMIREGIVSSVRISTRPDYITEENAGFLKSMEVATVELGAESLIDEVLAASLRGHDAADVVKAVGILKSNGIETGIHLMAGLPGDSRAGFIETVKLTVMLAPDMVRIHPAVVFAGTRLAELYTSGEYRPLGLDEAVDYCREALVRFTLAGIPVIRMGLQATPEMEADGNVLAGPFHPSFGMLVESSLFLEMAGGLLAGFPREPGSEITMVCAPADESSLRGLKNSNLQILRSSSPQGALIIRADKSIPEGSLTAVAGTRIHTTSIREFYGGVNICSNQGS
jgi:histone acetyltransferase (RNA polymerase elongator complex component)